ncbi:MAG: helix-turn-helix domain-containing protein [Pyrinomonadaceae bacterium]
MTDSLLAAYKWDMKLITTADAAERLGIHQTRVQVLIRGGRLPAQMLGGTYLINEDDLRLVADRKPGRPLKQEAQAGTPAPTKARRKAPTKY